MKYRSMFALLLCLSTLPIVAMEEEPIKTDYSQDEENPLIVTTTDKYEFKLGPYWVDMSAMLKEWGELGTDEKPQIQISAKGLEALLKLVDYPNPKKDTLDNVSLDTLINLTEGADFLMLEMNDDQKNVLISALANKMSWQDADLVKFFDDARIPENIQKAIIRKMAYKGWDKDTLSAIYKAKSLSNAAKLFIISELIRSKGGLIAAIVGRQINIAEPGVGFAVYMIDAKDEDKKLSNFIKKFIGEEAYGKIKNNLEKEYPGF